jgi:hypothetical protein
MTDQERSQMQDWTLQMTAGDHVGEPYTVHSREVLAAALQLSMPFLALIIDGPIVLTITPAAEA